MENRGRGVFFSSFVTLEGIISIQNGSWFLDIKTLTSLSVCGVKVGCAESIWGISVSRTCESKATAYKMVPKWTAETSNVLA